LPLKLNKLNELNKLMKRIPNFNLIPPEYRRRIIPRRQRVIQLLLLLMIVVAASFIPGLYQRRTVHDAAIKAFQVDIAAIEAELERVSTERDEAEEWLTSIRAMKEEHHTLLNQRQRAWDELGVNPVEWHELTAAVFRSRLFSVQLSSVEMQGMRVTISGVAPNYVALLRYHGALLADPTISRIVSFDSEIVEATVSFSLVARIGEK
jgi:Tfp pilus assembly protein PilN